MLIHRTVENFVDILASDAPAPGGGSVAALAGAMAAGLVAMVCRLTMGRAKFASVEQEVKGLLDRGEILQRRLLELVDRDTESFNQVMAALKLPKDDEAAKEIRNQALQAATKAAAQVPLSTAELCLEVLQMAEDISRKGNPNAITDIGVAGKMAETGLQGAVYNVLINLGSIKDESFVQAARQKCEEWQSSAKEALARVQETVAKSL